jgi:hypothetical protein
MQADDVKRLKELEHENSGLKLIVADQALDIVALKDAAEDAPIHQIDVASAEESARSVWKISRVR